MILFSEIRINVNPLINVSIPGYSFIFFSSNTKAEGVGAYISTKIKFSENDNLRLMIRSC